MKLRLISIKCNVNDESDGDEIYLKYDSHKIWPHGLFKSIKMNEELEIDVTLDVPDDEYVTFELWDYDLLSRNDLLGSFTMRTNEKGGPFQTSLKMERLGDTASYLLTWEGN